MKLEVYRKILEKFANLKFHENPSNPSMRIGRTDRETWRIL